LRRDGFAKIDLGQGPHWAQPRPFVVVHPDDAAARGLKHGARARMWN